MSLVLKHKIEKWRRAPPCVGIGLLNDHKRESVDNLQRELPGPVVVADLDTERAADGSVSTTAILVVENATRDAKGRAEGTAKDTADASPPGGPVPARTHDVEQTPGRGIGNAWNWYGGGWTQTGRY